VLTHLARIAGIVLIVGVCLYAEEDSFSQTTPGPEPGGMPAVPQGVEVMARGPVHEAFAAPATEPK
jgi:hypothetical protein